MNDSSEIDWAKLYKERRSIADRFGEIWDLPVAKRYHQVLSALGTEGVSMLEVGAGDRGLREKMAGYWGGFDYRSCDIDTSYRHDYSHIDEVTGNYELICGFEVIEHLSLGDAHYLLNRCFELLKPGGRIALTTPNIFYPPSFLRDATHITPFCFDELGGLLQLSGFKVTQINRLYHDSLVKKFARRVLFYPLFRVMGIDFARQIMVVAEKPST